jgi:hypothetical protein
MRGKFDDQGALFSYISPEKRVPENHPLREIRELVRNEGITADRRRRGVFQQTVRAKAETAPVSDEASGPDVRPMSTSLYRHWRAQHNPIGWCEPISCARIRD